MRTRSWQSSASPACPIVDENGKLIGIITNRDMKFETDMSRRIDEVMTKTGLVTGLVGTTLDEAKAILAEEPYREASHSR